MVTLSSATLPSRAQEIISNQRLQIGSVHSSKCLDKLQTVKTQWHIHRSTVCDQRTTDSMQTTLTPHAYFKQPSFGFSMKMASVVQLDALHHGCDAASFPV